MKIKDTLNIVAGLVLLPLAPLTRAQCPQSCDGNNTAIGSGALSDNQSGLHNTAVGYVAGASILTGSYNTAVGDTALGQPFFGCIQGSNNTAVGANALDGNSGANNTGIGANAMTNIGCGSDNTAIGEEAMFGTFVNADFIQGSDNTATGYRALYSITTGSNNTGSGYQALFSDTTGGSNTVSGYDALYFNTTGNFNTATGRGALYRNTTASYNVATGYQALNSIKTFGGNTATGTQALQSDTGGGNTADGYQALNKNTVGVQNVATGSQALFANTSGITNTAVGGFALGNSQTGSGNIALGYTAGSVMTSGSNNVDIANTGANESGTIRIGSSNQTNTYIAGISGVTVAGGIGVIVDSGGHLGTATSSARYKENIQPMDKASEAILALQPVTFCYKHDLDPAGIPQFGLVAEQVEKVNPDLVARDDQGKPYTVRYEAVNAMLLNEFLKAHQKIEEQARANQEQKVINNRLEATVAQLQSALKAQAAQIQKVSDELRTQGLAPRVVAND